MIRKLLIAIIPFAFLKCSPDRTTSWTDLFSGRDLRGWDTYIGPAFDSAGNRDSIPLGLNNDTLNVFSVVTLEGKPALRISGERFGGISTTQEFSNYHLRMEMKWGREKWHPRKNQKRDSGILYHATGPHGADFGFWMSSQEFQVQEGDCGDYWGVAGGSFEIPSRRTAKGDWIYTSDGPLQRFDEKSENGRHVIKQPDAEKPTGEWNVMEVICFGDTAIHVVNGTVVMKLYGSALLRGEKRERLARGKIQLQSEGAEVYYRNIEVRSIDSIPEEFDH